ncbi:DUF4440 domain-containing protein [Autumnicola musiva]|uniref:DUF4440 domain-containing protein n=1 Tax=Autumnicola musiva TaxID=3075589 RepID=A0ABU3D6E5_9FLAO|nr:DUF4440 domain-containing protein [Zunongwangia sp. F117]MDT0677098.1 DUF4440 domain-containing protein [Zunongwangia sp. F117]
MIKIIQLSLLLFLIAPASAQTCVKENEEQIKDLIISSFDDIFSDMDTEKLEKYYSDDFLLLENGEVWDMDIITSYMNRAKAQGAQPERINSFDFIEIKIWDKMAWVAYRNKAIFKKDDKVVNEMNWLESATAVFTENGWKLQMLHSTLIQDEQQ